jgi:hypothetical protein
MMVLRDITFVAADPASERSRSPHVQEKRMNVYLIYPVLDNPLYEGLALTDRSELLDYWPADLRPNFQTWQPRSLKATWPTPEVIGNVRRFNDYPCINLSRPAFSQRAVDLLRDILEPNGELLPVRHKIGRYYFYNCTCMTSCVDLSKSKITRLSDGGIVFGTKKLVFFDEMLDDLTIFKIRTQLLELFCTWRFVDRVERVGLRGFAFIPIWPLPEGVTFFQEMHRINQLSRKLRPKEHTELDVKENTGVLRLHCQRKKATKKDLAATEEVMSRLEQTLYDESQQDGDSYFGNVEGHDVVDAEIRVFLSAPDCDRLVTHLMPTLRTLFLPGKSQVVKRRGEYTQIDVVEEYIRIE